MKKRIQFLLNSYADKDDDEDNEENDVKTREIIQFLTFRL